MFWSCTLEFVLQEGYIQIVGIKEKQQYKWCMTNKL